MAGSVTTLSEEAERYRRQTVIPGFGSAGQARLKAGAALVVGVGGLGSPIALYLAAAGVGRIGLVDDDTVDAANLQRQILYATAEVGRAKLEVARERLVALNPDVRVEPHGVRFDEDNAARIASEYDVIVDGTDNLSTRYLLNEIAVSRGIPYVYGAVIRFAGQASAFDATRGPCYRCLFPTPPPRDAVPSPAEMGVLGPVPGVIGCVEATEAIKLIIGIGDPLIGRLLLYDALTLRFDEVRIEKQPGCPTCGAAAAPSR